MKFHRYWGEDSKPESQSNPNALSSLLQKIDERRKNKRKIQDSGEIKEAIQTKQEKPSTDEQTPTKKPKLDSPEVEASSERPDPENFTILKNLDFKRIQKVNIIIFV